MYNKIHRLKSLRITSVRRRLFALNRASIRSKLEMTRSGFSPCYIQYSHHTSGSPRIRWSAGICHAVVSNLARHIRITTINKHLYHWRTFHSKVIYRSTSFFLRLPSRIYQLSKLKLACILPQKSKYLHTKFNWNRRFSWEPKIARQKNFRMYNINKEVQK